jgi:hypothetical protein
MNHHLKLQAFTLGLGLVYILMRLFSLLDLPFSPWQQIIFGSYAKDILFLLFCLFLFYAIFNLIRHQPRRGPTLIKGATLKKLLFISLICLWLAIIIHSTFQSLKIALPFTWLAVYRWSEFLDETLAHILMFLPLILLSFVASFLEIERPSPQALTKKELVLMVLLSFIFGIAWGLNLTEGHLSLFTSFPAMLLYLAITLVTVFRYRLSLRPRPWLLFFLISYSAGSLSFIIWGICFRSFPEVFAILPLLR